MFLVLQAIKTYIGYKLVDAAVLSIKNLKSKVTTLYQLLSRAQQNKYTKSAEYSTHCEQSQIQ